LTAQEWTRRYYRFTAPDDGSTDFYDGQGRSITKFLLRKPVISGQLGDGFGWRIHPILHDHRFHEGVDYAVPMAPGRRGGRGRCGAHRTVMGLWEVYPHPT
jgi:murein DD-endopeptidase MepM/ murein hydrolase activator NlpD